MRATGTFEWVRLLLLQVIDEEIDEESLWDLMMVSGTQWVLMKCLLSGRESQRVIEDHTMADSTFLLS